MLLKEESEKNIWKRKDAAPKTRNLWLKKIKRKEDIHTKSSSSIHLLWFLSFSSLKNLNPLLREPTFSSVPRAALPPLAVDL